MTSPTSLLPRDVPFKKAPAELPQQLRDALVDSELADPGILMSYQRSSPTQLGLPSVLPSAVSRRRLTKKGGTAAPGTQLAEVRHSYVRGRSGTDMDVCRGDSTSGIDITIPLSFSSPPLPLSPSSSTPSASVSKPGPIVQLVNECVDGHDSGCSDRVSEVVDGQFSSEAQERKVSVGADRTDGGAVVEEVSRGETPQRVLGPMHKSMDERVQSKKRAKNTAKRGFSHRHAKKKRKSKSAEIARQVCQMEGGAQGPGIEIPFPSFYGSEIPSGTFHGYEIPSRSFHGSEIPSLNFHGSEIPSLSFHWHDIPSQSFTPELGDLVQSCAAQHSGASVVTPEMVSSGPGYSVRPPQSSTSSISELTPFSEAPPSSDLPVLSEASDRAHSDAQLLYYTLVSDGAIPGGFVTEFEAFMLSVLPAAQRQAKAWAHTKEEDVSLWLSAFKDSQQEIDRKARIEADRAKAAWNQKPKRYKTRFERTLYSGPTPRKDAEEEERTRWVHELALLVSGSDTPMGKLLSEQPGNVSVLGAGLRASTLRSRVRVLKKFFKWLAISHNVLFPTEISHFSDYLKLRLSEPCNRGALKNTNEAFGFLEEVTGMPEAQRRTSNELYQVVYREIRSSALPGKPSKQAPRMLVTIIEALERCVVSAQVAPYLRVYAWWVLVQNWATLRFSDHRGLDPSSISVSCGELVAKLTRSKTIGPDKNIHSRPVFVSACCYITVSGWMSTGWELLNSLAEFRRDYLLPAPAANLTGALQAELRYDTGFAILSRTLAALRLNDGSEFPLSLASFWTPHSGRTFMPSSTAALQFPTEERNFLGGWQAQASDRYAMVARLRVQNMQKAVVQSIQRSRSGDLLEESETLTHFAEFMVEKSFPEDQQAKLITALQTLVPTPELRPSEELAPVQLDPTDMCVPAPLMDPQPLELEPAPQTEPQLKKRRGGHAAARTELLGDNPRERRAAIRSTLQPGYYIALSGKRHIRTLHKLGACYALPEVDYLQYSFVGTSTSANTEFDSVCKLCAKSSAAERENSDVPVTSSSSAEEN